MTKFWTQASLIGVLVLLSRTRLSGHKIKTSSSNAAQEFFSNAAQEFLLLNESEQLRHLYPQVSKLISWVNSATWVIAFHELLKLASFLEVRYSGVMPRPCETSPRPCETSRDLSTCVPGLRNLFPRIFHGNQVRKSHQEDHNGCFLASILEKFHNKKLVH